MAVVLTGDKTFRLPAETIEALERLAVLTGRSQTAVITTLVRHFEASVLKPLGPEELQAYREGELKPSPGLLRSPPMVLSREPVARPSMALPAPGHLPPPCRQGVVLQVALCTSVPRRSPRSARRSAASAPGPSG